MLALNKLVAQKADETIEFFDSTKPYLLNQQSRNHKFFSRQLRVATLTGFGAEPRISMRDESLTLPRRACQSFT